MIDDAPAGNRRLDDALDALSGRVQKLENRFWVAVTVAGILGAGGIWGLNSFNHVRTTLNSLHEEVRRAGTDFETRKREVLAELRRDSQEATEIQIQQLSATNETTMRAQFLALERQPRKVCGIYADPNFRYHIVVPNSWTVADCDRMRGLTGAGNSQPMCMYDNRIALRDERPGCGW